MLSNSFLCHLCDSVRDANLQQMWGSKAWSKVWTYAWADAEAWAELRGWIDSDVTKQLATVRVQLFNSVQSSGNVERCDCFCCRLIDYFRWKWKKLTLDYYWRHLIPPYTELLGTVVRMIMYAVAERWDNLYKFIALCHKLVGNLPT